MALGTSKPVYTFNQAKELLTDSHACLKLTTAILHIALAPKHLGNVKTGVLEQLNAQLRLYNEQLNGVIISYSNIKIQQQHGFVLTSEPFVHFDIYADFVIFQPMIGSIIKAIITKIGKGYIGGLVHECFNISFKESIDKNNEEHQIGDEILLQIQSINRTRDGIISIKAKPADLRINTSKRKRTDSEVNLQEESCFTPPSSVSKKRKIGSDTNENFVTPNAITHSSTSSVASADSGISFPVNDDDLNDSVSKSHKKKKKKKVHDDSDTIHDSINSVELNMNNSLDDSAVVNSHKKKKHKHKEKRGSLNTTDNESFMELDSSMVFTEINSSPRKKKKKSKDKRD